MIMVGEDEEGGWDEVKEMKGGDERIKNERMDEEGIWWEEKKISREGGQEEEEEERGHLPGWGWLTLRDWLSRGSQVFATAKYDFRSFVELLPNWESQTGRPWAYPRRPWGRIHGWKEGPVTLFYRKAPIC